jgi:excisionase family DNA binding protein
MILRMRSRSTLFLNGAAHSDDPGHLLSPQELADYLNVPIATLYSWRHAGDGPPGFRVGKHVRYRWIDVQEWVQDQFEAARKHHNDLQGARTDSDTRSKVSSRTAPGGH